ncbi:hypothetical protein SISSUDRAFT_984350 [Sistotremastrum suecicum HHB10207 ss-3]|uniref:Mediator of RNA polymerase II transcription subunit 10 n=1 Tax=Sistotremastrum suecicum HHB10207 ss-3 TaxID=1314776 RepID=A0A166EPD9_9AGAM|nr:hypothetical protein SISSUDRAFT_984350 [Sistotremastrum suecicum HHB10207 ss-3]
MAHWDTPAQRSAAAASTSTRNAPSPIAIPSPGANDSPRPDSPISPAPTGLNGDIELELIALANALYNLGTTAINDNSREKLDQNGNKPQKQIGSRVNEVVRHLATIEDLSRNVTTTIPIQVLADVDNARNPMILTRDRIERAALENQFMNGKIDAIQTYTELLDSALEQAFPELSPYLNPDSANTTESKTHDVDGGIETTKAENDMDQRPDPALNSTSTT